MNFKTASACVSLIASSVLAVSTAPAFAGSFNFTKNPGTCAGGAASLTLNGFQLIANGGQLECKTVVDNSLADDGFAGPVTGIGVTGNPDDVPGEIGPNPIESIDLILPSQGVLKSLDLSFLYQPGVFSDEVFEVMAAIPDTAASQQGTLKITGNQTAVWTWGNVSQTIQANSSSTDGSAPGTFVGGGWYSILNPFNGLSLNKVTLLPVPQEGPNPRSFRNSEFALVGAEVETSRVPERVPEPATLAGLGLVAASVAASRRRKTS